MFPYKQYAKIGARPTKIDLLAHARRLIAVFPKTRLSVTRDHEKKNIGREAVKQGLKTNLRNIRRIRACRPIAG